MSFFSPDEEKFNYFIENSFVSSIYKHITNFIKSLTEIFPQNFFISKYIDNVYFVFLGIMIFAIPFANSSSLGLLASILIIISILSSLFRHEKFEFSIIHLPVFIYLAILFISVGFSALPLPSLKGLSKMLIYIGAFFSFFEFLKKNPNKIFPTVLLIAISTSFELLFSLKQMIFGVNELAGWQDKTTLNPEAEMTRIFGTLKPFNPNLFAAYVLSCTPMIFISSIYMWFKNLPKISITFAGFGLLALLTIVQTGCRGAYIGLFFGMILFFILLYRTFRAQFEQIKNLKKIIQYTVIAIIIAGILAAIFSPAISHRLTSIFTFRGDSSNSYRMNVYISSLKMFMDNFLVGIGPGNTTYRLVYGLYMVTGFDALGAYNIYLEMAVESGIFALITFIWLMVLTFFKSIQKLFETNVTSKLIIIGILTALISMLMHGFFDTVWYRPQLQLLFWLYLAIASVITLKGFSNEQ